MVTYIKTHVKGNMITLENALNEALYDNIGTTYEDYLNGKYVRLSDEQVAFHNEHPTASIKEVWDMEMHVETLEEVKRNKVNEITMYDASSSVNEFYYNNQPFWLDKSTRVGLVNSTNMEITMGRETTTLILGETIVELPCTNALQMLAALEVYAKDCYNVTAHHVINVNALEDIEEVRNYDYTTGYPEKLRF